KIESLSQLYKILYEDEAPEYHIIELRRDERVMMLAREFAARGKFLAAICAAPLILHDAGLLETARFCAHASTRSELPNGLDERLVIDNKLITSRGAGTAIDFGLALVAQLAGAPAAEKVAADIMV
ncbi:MAG: DJ-1/PfpI family protein, partial [Luteolibacter sp.]